MGRVKTSSLLLCLFLVETVCVAPSCAKQPVQSNTVKTESQREPNSTPASSTAAQNSPALKPVTDPMTAAASPSSLPPPALREVGVTVTRVFQKVAVVETTSNTSFVVGDFNGDGSEDLAVVVKPNEAQLPEVNNELANWILEDPRKVLLPRAGVALPPPNRPVPVRAEKGDTLLAIIHGVGAQGWRNAESRQTFLLKNGPGSNLSTRSMKSLRESKDKQKLPPIRGDAISGAIEGKAGLIVWTGAKYAWYSPDVK